MDERGLEWNTVKFIFLMRYLGEVTATRTWKRMRVEEAIKPLSPQLCPLLAIHITAIMMADCLCR